MGSGGQRPRKAFEVLSIDFCPRISFFSFLRRRGRGRRECRFNNIEDSCQSIHNNGLKVVLSKKSLTTKIPQIVAAPSTSSDSLWVRPAHWMAQMLSSRKSKGFHTCSCRCCYHYHKTKIDARVLFPDMRDPREGASKKLHRSIVVPSQVKPRQTREALCSHILKCVCLLLGKPYSIAHSKVRQRGRGLVLASAIRRKGGCHV